MHPLLCSVLLLLLLLLLLLHVLLLCHCDVYDYALRKRNPVLVILVICTSYLKGSALEQVEEEIWEHLASGKRLLKQCMCVCLLLVSERCDVVDSDNNLQYITTIHCYPSRPMYVLIHLSNCRFCVVLSKITDRTLMSTHGTFHICVL